MEQGARPVTARERGVCGEQFAADWLETQGYQILARSWRSGHAEIDLIARRAEVVAFVEVKTRGPRALESPAASVSRAQRRRIVLAAADYLHGAGARDAADCQPRFDIFEVWAAQGAPFRMLSFRHLPGAYDTGDLNVFI